MNKEHSHHLFMRFKFFRPERPLTEGLMGLGFECGDGWYDLLLQLCLDIERELQRCPPNSYAPFEVLQVKEKYGTLRFYPNWGTQPVHDLIRKAELKSAKTCEVCGKPGKLIQAPWMTTRCVRHQNE